MRLLRCATEKLLALVDWLEPREVVLGFFRKRSRTFLIVGFILVVSTEILQLNFRSTNQAYSIDLASPQNWDHLFLSGLMLLFVGIWISLNLGRKNDQLVRRLVNRGSLENYGNVESLIRYINDYASRWSHRIATFLALALPVVFVVGLILRSNPSRSFLIEWTLVGVVGGYVAGRFLGRMVAYGYLGRVLIDRGVNFIVHPGHIDRACGFRPFGDFFFFQAMLVALPALHLSVWSILFLLRTYEKYSNWTVVYLSLLPIAILFVVLSFFMPMLSVHTIMKRKKTCLLNEADELSKEILKLQLVLEHTRSSGDFQREKDRLQFMIQRHHDIEKMPTWPANFNTMRLFFGNSLVLTLPLVIELIKVTGIWKELTKT